jgi:hypothetical protein
MKRPREYNASKIEDKQKTNLARLYVDQKAAGKTRKEFTAEMARAGWEFSERQLDRWAKRIKLDMDAISTEKRPSSFPALTRSQKDISSGWVLDQIEHGNSVHLEDFCAFVLDQLLIKIERRTASNYLKEDGFTYRVIQKKSASFSVDVDKLRDDLWNWVKLNQSSLKDIPLSKLCSIDFTFSGHRTERRTGFGIKGGAQPMEALKISKFTNCIVTCVWADGINRTPPVLFTYNPKFRMNRPSTAKRDADVEHLQERLAHHGISEDRVIYIGKEKYEKETYAKECPGLLRRFFALYGVPPDATILSDNGHSFFENSVSVLREIGFKDHRCYPANVHQWLSVNDNALHGTSKAAWRSARIDYSDDVDSCLTLLHFLDRDIINHSKAWFKRNMLALEEKDVGDLIGTRGSKKSHLHRSWLRAYRIFMGQDARGSRPNIPEEIQDSLDGLYWEKKK